MSVNHKSVVINKCCGFIVSLLGLAVVTRWCCHINFLLWGFSADTPPYLSTGLGLIAAGVGLFAINDKQGTIAFSSGIVIAIISCITLLNYGFGIDLNPNRFLLGQSISAKAVLPSFSEVFCAAGLLCTSMMLVSRLIPESEWRYFCIRLSATLVLILGVVLFIGATMGLEMGHVNGMALQTASAFIFLGIGACAYVCQTELSATGNILAIWFSMLASVVISVFGIAVWLHAMTRDKALVHERVHEAAQHHTFVLYLELITCILFSLLAGMTLYYAVIAAQRNRLLSKQSETLMYSEKRHQQLVDDIYDYAILGLDLNGNVESWSRGATRIYGYQAHEILEHSYVIFFTEEACRNGMPQNMIKIALDTGYFHGEVEYLKKDKSAFWASVIVERLQSAAGQFTGFAMVVQGISAKRLLDLERSRLIAIIDDSSDFIGMATLDGILLYHNSSAKKMVGLTQDEDLSRMSISDMHPQWAFDIVSGQGIPTAFRQGTWIGETALLHQKTKEIIPVLQTITLHRDTRGNPTCLTTVMRDITDRKKAEQAQEQLISQLVASNMELERFAYVASHDMQEPLRMVVCFSDILISEYAQELCDEARKYLAVMNDAGKRMQEMIQDLLEYSRISNNGTMFGTVDGAQALEHALENLHVYIEETKAVITYDTLPCFTGNAIQFTRLLQNLIINGIKYQEKNAVALIHIGVGKRDEKWLISVRDNGLGIPVEFQEHIFQPLSRLHHWDVIRGTGLGLAICKKIVESHGGTIWVESIFGRGSVFYFTLPNERVATSS